MKICFLGNFLVDYTSESHWAKTLEAMGHKVVRMQEGQTTTGFLLKQALSANLFVWVHTHSWSTQGNVTMPDLLEALRRRNIPAIAYHLDLFCGIASRWQTYQHDEYLTGGLSHFFTVDPRLADWLNANTQTKGIYLPAGVFEPECYLAAPTQPFDVAFVGSKRYHREWMQRPALIDWLERTYKDRFKLFGQDAGVVVRGAALNQVYANARVVVGDSFNPGFHYARYWSDRVYETTGRGGMIIHPRIDGLDDQFVEGEEIMFYGYNNHQELGDKIDHLLHNEDVREKMRLAGHERTKRDHTYKVRWQTILREVFGA